MNWPGPRSRARAAKRTPPPEPPLGGRLRILWVDARHARLFSAAHLGEFDAIVFDQQASAVRDGLDGLSPGYSLQVTGQVFDEMRRRLGERATELRAFLNSGGLLVVRLRAPSGLSTASNVLFRGDQVSLSLADWWMVCVAPLWQLHEADIETVLGAQGSRITVDEPAHAFEPYLRLAGYAATLQHLALTDGRLVKLASNPVGDAVGAECVVSEGAVVILPAEGDDEILADGVHAWLTLRRARRDTWPLPQEQTLISRLDAIEASFLAERDGIFKGLAEIATKKNRVMQDHDVRRILDRFRRATRASTAPAEALIHLHAAVEIIEERLGGERALVATLSIPKARVNAVKQPANDRALASRHVGTGDDRPVPSEQLDEALSATSAVITAFLSHLYDALAEQPSLKPA
jgi:hypothetical protein